MVHQMERDEIPELRGLVADDGYGLCCQTGIQVAHGRLQRFRVRSGEDPLHGGDGREGTCGEIGHRTFLLAWMWKQNGTVQAHKAYTVPGGTLSRIFARLGGFRIA